ncbi:MAG: FAD-dependent oxidoreductase [Sphaerochaetaceae bacterium]|nr:FAD-dependent oxidoreductase [Sphaerochaetaceae bacterium]
MRAEIEIAESLSFDCIVCGGGPSGIAAAIASSEQGLRTAILERTGSFGGTAVMSGVNHLLGGRFYHEDTKVMEKTVGGIFDDLVDRMIFEGIAIAPEEIDPYNNPHGWYPRMAAGIPFDGNAVKGLLDRILIEKKVVPYLFTKVIGAEVDSGNISSLIVNNKSGNLKMKASYYIDATGDADVASSAGCRFEKGRSADMLMTPASLEFHVDNVDRERLLEYQNQNKSPKLVEIIDELKKKGIWDFPFDIFVTVQLNDPDVFMVNTLRETFVDGTNGDDITKAMMKGRADVFKLHRIMKEYFPGFSRSRIRYIADVLGVRETRRIVGMKHVTLEDAKSGRVYEDQVARTTYNFDLPDPKRPSYDPMMGSAKKPDAKRQHISIEVPYGVMVPDRVGNLLVTGRAVSVDREVLGALRVMGPCMMLGEAAGTAVAAAKEKGQRCADVNGKELRKQLIERGLLFGR